VTQSLLPDNEAAYLHGYTPSKHMRLPKRSLLTKAPQVECLPDELLQLVFKALSTSDLKHAAVVSKCFYRHATDFLWHEVALVDTWKLHKTTQYQIYSSRGEGDLDDHDDTPIIQKLFILAK
jgi:hypothetical protein